MSGSNPDRFTTDLARMLLVFFAITAIDVVVISLMTGQLRFWFPVWLDPGWAQRDDPWVIYSQSYFAGIFLIPFLLHAIDRAWLQDRAALRVTLWVVGLGAFGFILWWKGGLMVEHDKHVEAIGWGALTLLLFGMVRLAEALPARVARLGRRRLLRGLLFGISGFFLVMAVLDPVIQIGVQELGWSTGLIIEVGFFVPAGVLLLFVARRLGGPAQTPKAAR